MINPMTIFQAMRQGKSPMHMAQQMAMQDPRAQRALQLMQGKTTEQMEQIARNMAREKGIDLDAELQKLTGG